MAPYLLNIQYERSHFRNFRQKKIPVQAPGGN